MALITLSDGDSLFDQWQIEEEVLTSIHCDVRTECWIWQGTRTPEPRAYGRITSPCLIRAILAKGAPFRLGTSDILVHRYVYWTRFHWLPRYPGGLDHKEELCPGRRYLCCNPGHLEAVTDRLNSARASKSRRRPVEDYPRIFDPTKYEEGLLKREW